MCTDLGFQLYTCMNTWKEVVIKRNEGKPISNFETMLSNTVVTSHMWLLKTEMWVIRTESITEIHTRFQTPNSKEKKKKGMQNIPHTIFYTNYI